MTTWREPQRRRTEKKEDSERRASVSCFSVFTQYVSLSFYPLFFTRPAYRRGRCALVQVMPARPHNAISGILAGGESRVSAQPESEAELQTALIAMIPISEGPHDTGGLLVRDLLAEFLRGFSLRTLIFILDMVLPQLDAYHTGRHLQHLQPWVSVELMQQQQQRGQIGTHMPATYQYEAHAGFHVIQLHTDGAPILLFCAPSDVPQVAPKDLCAAGSLGNMEATSWRQSPPKCIAAS